MSAERHAVLQQKLSEHSSLKSLQIILALTTVNEYMSINELAEITLLSASTIHRILQELLECNYVCKDEVQKKYRIGFEAMSLAMSLKTSDYLLEASKEEMERLGNMSLETVNLIGLNGNQGVYVGKVEAKNQIGLRSKVGWKLPLYCTSGGKTLLAYQSEQWLNEYFKTVPLKQYTDYTIVDEQKLRQELERVKQDGFALDNREHNPDIICLAAPIFSGGGGIIGTIGIAAPDYRFPIEKALSYSDEIKKAADSITRKLQE